MALESSIVKAIVKAVKALGCNAEKTHGGAYGKAGRADLYITVPVTYQSWPVSLYVEVKQPGKESTPLQKAWARNMRSFGCTVVEAHSVEEVVKVIRIVRDWNIVDVFTKDQLRQGIVV